MAALNYPAQSPSITLRSLSPVDLATVIRRHLGLPAAGAPDPLALLAAALRAALWGISGGKKPAYVTRVLSAAARQLPPPLLSSISIDTGERAATEVLRTAFDELAALGDVSELPQGYWLPAPLRVVPLTEARRWLLVGGVPTSILPEPLRRALHHAGGGRLLDAALHDMGIALPEQRLDDWIGRPSQPLQSWAAEALAQAPLLSVGEVADGWEVYHPESASRLQYYRWRPVTGPLPDGRYLARSPLGWGPSRYRVVGLRGGRIVDSGALALGRGDLRRLLYGLDALARRPTQVTLRQDRHAAVLEIRNALPAPESRLLQALGRVELPDDGKFYPQLWHLPAAHIAEVARALAELGVEVRA